MQAFAATFHQQTEILITTFVYRVCQFLHGGVVLFFIRCRKPRNRIDMATVSMLASKEGMTDG